MSGTCRTWACRCRPFRASRETPPFVTDAAALRFVLGHADGIDDHSDVVLGIDHGEQDPGPYRRAESDDDLWPCGGCSLRDHRILASHT